MTLNILAHEGRWSWRDRLRAKIQNSYLLPRNPTANKQIVSPLSTTSPDTSVSGACLYTSRKSINTCKTYTFLTFFVSLKFGVLLTSMASKDLNKYTIEKNYCPQQSDVLD